MAHNRDVNRNRLREFEVGTYRELLARSIRGDDLDIHHVLQKQIGLDLIPALRVHLELYAHVYEKPGGSNGVIVDARSVLTSLQQAATNEITQEAARQASKRVAEYQQKLHDKAQACHSTGNRLSRLPANVQ
ncbi:unnamed protein product [Rotaria magnacalcarata]|uniref:Uncharacterized protein n=1 Tax=Rotaria magnacalcarata TaxID=392030 RepID=A0A816F0M2_9BILA|nr:unnamed protein product [Rotaria magnacalcarata]CAF1654910.1 unnamed protein product [Rotaria magnacalcarata]CAF2064093.1 unnamed protein product [Rotaria magnacalcarata]CAF4106094.1 unnamed protein product [Rotaria magnacalcarata]CAF4492504.1 unnamed protein product [Rotaria magnacalcarata]